MRQIKFRVWDKVQQKYIYDPVELELLFLELNITVSKPVIGFAPEYFERFVFEQYTGLKDRNGVEIYEGDVLKHYEQNLIEWVVCFENGCFGIKNGTHHSAVFYPIDSLYFFVDRIIIGNIHTKTDSSVQP